MNELRYIWCFKITWLLVIVIALYYWYSSLQRQEEEEKLKKIEEEKVCITHKLIFFTSNLCQLFCIMFIDCILELYSRREINSWAHHPLTRELMSSRTFQFSKEILIFQPSYWKINISWRRFINIAMFISFLNVLTRYRGQYNTQHHVNVYIGDCKEDMTVIGSYVC